MSSPPSGARAVLMTRWSGESMPTDTSKRSRQRVASARNTIPHHDALSDLARHVRNLELRISKELALKLDEIPNTIVRERRQNLMAESQSVHATIVELLDPTSSGTF